jgi:hypothetical protein
MMQIYEVLGSLEHAVQMARDKIMEQAEQIKAKHTLMGEVAQDLLELYDQYVDSVPAEVYGSILGLHDRLEQDVKVSE